MKTELIQPRHNYAAPNGPGHIYLPTSLLTAGARLLEAGIDVELHDENIRPAVINSAYVGINLLGAPYIPEVIQLQQRLARQVINPKFMLGGRTISGLSKEQFARLFQNSVNGNNDTELTALLGVELIPREQTSLIPAYKEVSDEDMRGYLSREFSLYVSQGCRKDCDFCSAERTTIDPLTREIVKGREQYRDFQVLEQDLEYLSQRAARLGLSKLDIYLSNLDVFQSPAQVRRLAKTVKNVKARNPAEIRLRGLSCVDSFLRARRTNCIDEIVEAGFHTVGFGVDGWGEETWRKVNKCSNTENDCIEAIRSTREDYGLTPEILMVFGHLEADTEQSLKAACEITAQMIQGYGAIPRPHVSKAFIPGNNGWLEERYAKAREQLMQNPLAFQALDFTALPSRLTHPQPELREQATKYFLKMCELPGNTTQYVLPIEPGMSRAEIAGIQRFNEGRFDR